MTAEIVERPDGRLYRARKTPHAEMLGGDWDDSSVIVWRTHDVDVAVPLAGQEWRQQVGCDPIPGHVTVGWFKSFPWDPMGGYDGSVQEVLVTEKGAVPAVMFR